MEGLSQSESNSFHTYSSEMHLRRWSCEADIWHTSRCQQRLCRTQVDKLQSNRNTVLNSMDISLMLTCQFVTVLDLSIRRSHFADIYGLKIQISLIMRMLMEIKPLGRMELFRHQLGFAFIFAQKTKVCIVPLRRNIFLCCILRVSLIFLLF